MLAVLEDLSNFIGRKSYGLSFDPEPAALRPIKLPVELPRPLFPGQPAPGSWAGERPQDARSMPRSSLYIVPSMIHRPRSSSCTGARQSLAYGAARCRYLNHPKNPLKKIPREFRRIFWNRLGRFYAYHYLSKTPPKVFLFLFIGCGRYVALPTRADLLFRSVSGLPTASVISPGPCQAL